MGFRVNILSMMSWVVAGRKPAVLNFPHFWFYTVGF
jgi:hypothetical protein